MRIRFSLAQLFLLAVLCSLLALLFTAIARSGRPRRPVGIHFSPGGDYLAVQYTDVTEIWRRTQGAFRKTPFSFPTQQISWAVRARHSPFVDESTIYVIRRGAAKSTIRLIDVETGETSKQFSIVGNLSDAYVSRDKSTVVVLHYDGSLEIWDWGASVSRLKGVKGNLFALSPDRTQIAVSSSGNVSAFDARSGSWLAFVGELRYGTALFYSPDGRYFAGYAQRRPELQVWSSKDFSLLKRISIPEGVQDAHFTADSNSLVVLDAAGEELSFHSVNEAGQDRRVGLKDWPIPQFAAIDDAGKTLAVALDKGVFVGGLNGRRRQTLWSRFTVQIIGHAVGLYAWAAVWGLWSRVEQGRQRAGDVIDFTKELAAPNGLILLWSLSASGGGLALLLAVYFFFQTGILFIPTFYLGIAIGLVTVSKGWGRSTRGLLPMCAFQSLNILNCDIFNLCLGLTGIAILRDPLVRAFLAGNSKSVARELTTELGVWSEKQEEAQEQALPER